MKCQQCGEEYAPRRYDRLKMCLRCIASRRKDSEKSAQQRYRAKNRVRDFLTGRTAKRTAEITERTDWRVAQRDPVFRRLDEAIASAGETVNWRGEYSMSYYGLEAGLERCRYGEGGEEE